VKHSATSAIHAAALFSILGLTACGGSSDTSTCVSGISTVCERLLPIGIVSAEVAAANAAAEAAQTAADAALAAAQAIPVFTTAPNAITMVAGRSASYGVGGGTGHYTATSSNTDVVTIAMSDKTLTLTSIAAGTASVAIMDSLGKFTSINVTVLGKGETVIPLSILPASITVGDCTTNIPFVFTGGTAPYTIFTSDNFQAPVSATLPLGSNSYFTASINYVGSQTVSASNPFKIIVTVLDGQSRTASADILVGSNSDCPKNPLLQIVSASQNAHVTETLAFQIVGGVAPFTVVSRDPAIATVSPTSKNSDGTSFFNATAISAGSSLLTVIGSDKQQANIVFTVFPAPALP
jgi:hypothetical protein